LVASSGVEGARLRDHVLQVKAVLSTGDEVVVGSRMMKSVAGYDLAKLFVGAWGTLGVVTEVTLRTAAAPVGATPRRARFEAAAFQTPLALRVRRAFDPECVFAEGVFRGR
jgi:FAD/FMN-containing dehydrogenase